MRFDERLLCQLVCNGLNTRQAAQIKTESALMALDQLFKGIAVWLKNGSANERFVCRLNWVCHASVLQTESSFFFS